ncbi:TonB-dependent siderophore receptor [Pigmentiphaga litoralis]|uniref:TonB-dependent siderophore receptor n=1 Tax=Pigmentiphaga litoralis TaxID=516702 RepID=UPI003B42E8AC
MSATSTSCRSINYLSPMQRFAPSVWASRLVVACVVLAGAMDAAGAESAAVPIALGKSFDVPAGPLADALNRYAVQCGVTVAVDAAQLRGLRSPGLKGVFTIEDGFRVLLAGSGQTAARTADGYVVRAAPVAATRDGGVAAVLPTVRVDGQAEVETANGPVAGYVAQRSATGTKTDIPLIDVPQSTSIVTADRLETIGAVTLKDALGYTPGIGIAPYGTDSRYDWVTIRGFEAYSPGFYLDGLPMRNNANFGLWRMQPYGAERLEILRGPSSVLYGLGNPGGVVNVVSKLPTAQPLRELQVQTGARGRKQVAGDVSGPLNDDGSLLYRLTALGRDAELPAGRMEDDYLFLAPSLTWKPSADTTATLMAQLGSTRSGVYTRIAPAYGSLLATPAGTRIPSDLFLGIAGANRFDQDQRLAGYQLSHRVDDTWTLKQNARASLVKLDYQQMTIEGYETKNEADTLDPANYRYVAFVPYAARERMTSFVIDNQAHAGLNWGEWRHDVLIGLEHQRSRLDAMTIYGGKAPSQDLLSARRDDAPITLADPASHAASVVRQTGLYVQDQMKWRRWSFTLGARYDNASSETIDKLAGNARTDARDTNVSTRAGVVYRAPNGWAPYVSYAESFAPTGVLDPISRTPFRAETGRQFEAGVRWQPAGRRQTLSAAIFDLRRKDFITYDPSFTPRQNGDASVRGLELEVLAELTRRLNLTGAYSLTPRAKVISSADPAKIGTQPLAVPRHRVSVWADYRWSTGFRIGAGVRHESSTWGADSAAPAQIPSQTLVDAMIGWDTRAWRLALNVQNVTDKAIITTCSARTCYYGSPRTVLATATYRW